MGKLHTLRRAIERDPSRWTRYGKAVGATRAKDGSWHPTWRWWGRPPYRDFVKHVLERAGVGNADGGPR